uniref:Uncharacterized protein n=1 Tax=Aegilops tauschii subsp. strangulata TaxID=200361 RepID=A0A453DVW4_AEGTS
SCVVEEREKPSPSRMRAALRLASALRRLPARTGDLVSSQAVLPPLAGRAPLLSRALSLPHLPAAVRRFSDKSPKDHLDRATTLIKQGELLVEEGKVISRHLPRGSRTPPRIGFATSNQA